LIVPLPQHVPADVLRDYLADELSDFERQRVERAIRDDAETASAVEIIGNGEKKIRDRLELNEEIPAAWLAIVSRWELTGRR
jgi:anti-sigma factor RsiW